MTRRLKWGLGLGALLALGAAGLWAWPSDHDETEGSGALDAGRSRSALLEAAPDDALDPRTSASLSGAVLDPQGKPAEAALIWAGDALGHLAQARTRADGSFRFTLRPGEYRLAAQRGAETSETEGPLPLGAGDDLRGLTLRLAPGARVAGTVFDLRSRAPLAGARVSVTATPLAALADARGHFALPPLASGEHLFAVSANAHLTRQVPFTARAGEDTRDLEIYLTPAAQLTGQVVTQDGTGVPQAALLIARYRAAGEGSPLLPAAPTDDSGHFALDLAPGLVQLVGRSPGFAEAISEMLDLTEGKATEVKLTLAAGAQIDGTLLTADGQPASGGQAAVYRGTQGWLLGEAPIGAGGHFTVSGLPAGHLIASADTGQARATAEVDLEAAGELQVTLRLGDHALEGVVVGGAGEPVEGARVAARPVGTGEAGERTALSASDGHFAISGLSGDRFDVVATKEEGTAEQRGVAAGKRDLRLTLAAGGVSGMVVGPGGLSVSDFFLAAEPELPGHGRPRATQAVDGRGEFHLSLSPGSYRLRATAPGFSEGKVDGVQVAAGADTRGVRVELRPAGTIAGTVLDEESRPVAGVHVATDRGHAWGVGRQSPLGGSGAISGPDGTFALRDVAPGTWTLFASASGWEQASAPEVTVQAGQNPGPVELRVRKSDGSGTQPYAGIGMALYPQNDRLFAGEVFAGGPAQEAGIRTGDLILAIDGASTEGQGVAEAAHRIRGPQGSEVTLEMRRGAEGEGYTVVVPRAEIRL